MRLKTTAITTAMILFIVCAPNTSAKNAADELQPPRLVHRVEPVYPPELQRARFQGEVVIAGTVPREGGRIRDARVTDSTDARFEKAALDAVAQWVWEPGVLNGQPVQVAFQTTVKFSLSDPNPSPAVPDQQPAIRKANPPRQRPVVTDRPDPDRELLRYWSVEIVQDGDILATAFSFDIVAKSALKRGPFTIRVHLAKPVDVRLNALPTDATFARINPRFDESSDCAEPPLFPCDGTGLALESYATWLFTGEDKTLSLPADTEAEQWTRIEKLDDGWIFERDVTEIDHRDIAVTRLETLYLLLALRNDTKVLGATDIRRLHLTFR